MINISSLIIPKLLLLFFIGLSSSYSEAQSIEDLFATGFELLISENYKEAIPYLDRVLEMDNQYSEAYFNRAIAHQRTEQYENALKDYSWVVNFSNDDELIRRASINNAYIYRKRLVNLEKALLNTRRALSLDSMSLDAIYAHALTLHSNQDYALAIEYYDKSILVDPSDPDFYYDRGIAKNALLRREEAIADYDIAIQLDSSYERAYHNRGFVNLILENYTEAIVDLNKSLKLEVSSSGYNNRGFAKLKLGDLRGAKLDCELAIKLDDTNSWAYHYLGLVYYEMGDKEKACELFYKAVELGKEEVSKEIEEKC